MISGSFICTSFKSQLLGGHHAFDTNQFFLALYTADAPLDPDATVEYITAGEVVAPGYTAGGQALGQAQILSMARTAYVTFPDAVWPNSSITARGGLIYNASYLESAVAILDFGQDCTSNLGVFQVRFPSAGPVTSLIRIV